MIGIVDQTPRIYSEFVDDSPLKSYRPSQLLDPACHSVTRSVKHTIQPKDVAA